MAKPDNRADNVEHLQQALNHTMENIREAETFLAAHGDDMNPKDVSALERKNERRREAIAGFREEIKDEAAHQRKHH
ncbi:protein Tlp [Alicyclobacillus hesperidum subsp. aegles]|uniref:small acid-soluble spore protein Tlp n=1 Tax=Alicyclobacillus hesperidum TaxID=89784 RepID=UPI0007192810|nr:small acid-soluble spore protein Tlp [Alicyclobacillus hesperidum]KRW92997.1 spore protein [Alicyclobacillus tengchongensis]GLG00404.1 protein Tlp [Alicyclobacillus hesperidum subsp. aegles]